MHPIIQNEPDYSLETHAISKIPHEITLVILNNLENLQDVNSFLATSHGALNLRPHILFIWAKKYGYAGDFKGGQAYLQDFFFKIAKVANTTPFQVHGKLIEKLGFKKEFQNKK